MVSSSGVKMGCVVFFLNFHFRHTLESGSYLLDWDFFWCSNYIVLTVVTRLLGALG